MSTELDLVVHEGCLSESMKEGILDEQFLQLQELEDESSPGFVRSLLDMYKEECHEKFNKIESALENKEDPDYATLDSISHQLKGSSASIGAPRTSRACALLREAGGKKDHERCLALMQDVRAAFQDYVSAAERVLSHASRSGSEGADPKHERQKDHPLEGCADGKESAVDTVEEEVESACVAKPGM